MRRILEEFGSGREDSRSLKRFLRRVFACILAISCLAESLPTSMSEEEELLERGKRAMFFKLVLALLGFCKGALVG